MQKFRKFIFNNYQFLWCFILLAIILFIAIDPEPFISSTFSGLKVWATIVLPSLFCFFIFTKLLMQNTATFKVFSLFDKPLAKLFNTPRYGGYIFTMSLISGYPMGANLISEFYNQKLITNAEAHRLCAYCSTSGPMFIIGSVASSMLGNIKIGIIVLTAHILSALINGLIFRNVNKNSIEAQKSLANIHLKKQTLNEILHNAIISSLMVGGFIAVSFSLLEIIQATNLLKPIYVCFEKISPNSQAILTSIFNGIVELTNGCVTLCPIKANTLTTAIILSGLVSFGGLSIHLQSYSFLSRCNIKYKYFLLTKVTHTIISIALALVLGIIML